jgi:microtubule-associated protein-like 5
LGYGLKWVPSCLYNVRLINALELFSGLIIFAESKFEEKVRFLFDLFDFNELNSLWLIELEFLIISCANATFKILSIGTEVNEEEISQFLNNYFAEDSRINIKQMLKWCIKTSEICEFFSLIKKESKEAPELKVGVT